MTPEFVKGIDWELLREQKHSLQAEIDDAWGIHKEHLIGILHLIDALQDYAADELGIKNVFLL